MIRRIVARRIPLVRTIIFQDDIFVFTKDRRVMALCEGIVAAKARGEIPANLQFISTNRIDADDAGTAAGHATCRVPVLGFGIESFSPRRARRSSTRRRSTASSRCSSARAKSASRRSSDLILSSPRSTLDDVAETLREAHRWLQQGYVRSACTRMHSILRRRRPSAQDPTLVPHTVMAEPARRRHQHRMAAGGEDPANRSDGARSHPAHRGAFEDLLYSLQSEVAHLPSRVRLAGLDSRVRIPVMAGHGIRDR